MNTATFTQQDIINAQTNAKIDIQDAKFNQFMDEMRDRDNQRHAEMMELRETIRALNESTDAKISRIENKVDGMGQHIRNLTYTSMAAIAAMVITVLLNLPK